MKDRDRNLFRRPKLGLTPNMRHNFSGHKFINYSIFIGNPLTSPSLSTFWLVNKNVQIKINKNLAVANRSRVSCTHNLSRASMIIPVTLKSRLTVTQGHWKWNHWVDHTRLTIRRVIGRWILSWPWNVGQRSLKVIEMSAIRKLGCGFLFAFYSNYGHICSRLWDIQCQRMA